MTFREAFNDLTVRAVRLNNWQAPLDYLEMPLIIKGSRTPWCYLVEQFSREGHSGRTPILSVELMDDNSDWQRFEIDASPIAVEGRD
jgi:hypothetical protein